ncbi:MAG TPA: ribosomal RNA small subunit methyltransferase I, partial [Pyrinomonadaceae bacterium]|nr:ribosomal RNA small subunit methyltransferase I [Pyrinomonadaceae bacterium]
YHEHNELRSGQKIIELARQGKSIALVTDAGVPAISDPGFTLVRQALDEGVGVTMIPGASAFVMALVLSGLPVHGFTFRGFPPRKPGPRRRFLEVDKDSPHTLIFYESPHRLKGFLEDAINVFGDRKAAMAAELTKMFENVNRGTLSTLLNSFDDDKLRGEYTVVIAGRPAKQRDNLEQLDID